MTDEYSDSSSEEQKSQSGASSDLVLDSEKTSDSGVLTNNSGNSTPVNVIPVQLSHTAPPFHMECPPTFEILHGTPILVHHHPADPMAAAAYYQPIPQFTEQLAPIGYQVIPEEQALEEPVDDDRPDDGEPAAGYSAENSDSGISSPNSEIMVKTSPANDKLESIGGAGDKHDSGKHDGKPLQATCNGSSGTNGAGGAGGTGGQTIASKKSRNKKSKQRDKTIDSAAKTTTVKNKDLLVTKGCYETSVGGGGSKKSSKIAKEPPIIQKLNAKKAAATKAGKPEQQANYEKLAEQVVASRSSEERRRDRDDDDDDDDDYGDADDATSIVEEDVIQLTINPDSAESVAAEWVQDEVFCSLECTPRSTTTDHVQFKFGKTQSLDSCESVEEETFATAVNTGNSDTENETFTTNTTTVEQEDVVTVLVTTLAEPMNSDDESVSVAAVATPPPGPITEAVTKWLKDQGGLVMAPCLDDSGTDNDDDNGDYGANDDDVEGDTDEGESEYDDFEEHHVPPPPITSTTTTTPTGPKNVLGNPYPALSRSEGSRVASGSASSHDQRKNGLISSGICCLTQ